MPIESQGGLHNIEALARAVSNLQVQMAPIALAYQGVWADRVLPSQSNIGQLWRITNVGLGGSSWWWSDGTNLRPMNGRVMLWSQASLLASPLATLTADGTSKDFAVPDNLEIPAGMLYPGMSVWAAAQIRRLAYAGVSGLTTCRLGTNSTTSNNSTFNYGTQGAANDWHAYGGARVVSSTSFLTSVANTSVNNTGAGLVFDRTTSFDTAQKNYVSFGVNSSVTVDSFALCSYAVWLEG